MGILFHQIDFRCGGVDAGPTAEPKLLDPIELLKLLKLLDLPSCVVLKLSLDAVGSLAHFPAVRPEPAESTNFILKYK